jgi:NADH-quinone oxidoreductase subunit N
MNQSFCFPSWAWANPLGFRRSNWLLLPVMMLILGLVLTVNSRLGTPVRSSFIVPDADHRTTSRWYSRALWCCLCCCALLAALRAGRRGPTWLNYSLLLFSLVGAIMLVSYTPAHAVSGHRDAEYHGRWLAPTAQPALQRSGPWVHFLMGAFFTGVATFGMLALVHKYRARSSSADQLRGPESRHHLAVANALHCMLLMLAGMVFCCAPPLPLTPDCMKARPSRYSHEHQVGSRNGRHCGGCSAVGEVFPGQLRPGVWLPIAHYVRAHRCSGQRGAVVQTSIAACWPTPVSTPATRLIRLRVWPTAPLEGLGQRRCLILLYLPVATVAAWQVVLVDARQRETTPPAWPGRANPVGLCLTVLH